MGCGQPGRDLVAAQRPLESVARALIVLGGFPEPTPQVRVTTRLGNVRVDLMGKENRREDALREQDYGLIRFTMPDTAKAAWLRAYRACLRLRR